MTTFARIAKILKGLVEPRNWVKEAFGDISGGGGGGVLIVRMDINENKLDKTWKEIADAIPNGAVIATYLKGGVSISPVYESAIGILDPRYQLFAYDYATSTSWVFIAATENDYPVLDQ